MSRQQRLTTWMAAATVMIGSLGVPLSTERVAKTGPAFPCQNCPCGCADAETCWRDCCCFTNRQKIVWAEKNGVKIPLFVTVAARREQAKAPAKPACCSEQVACEGSGEATCRDNPTEAPLVRSCCEKKQAAASASENSEGKVVLLITALKCRGISLSVGLLPPSLPPAHEALSLATVELGPRPVVAVTLYDSPCHDVATPPPDARDSFAS